MGMKKVPAIRREAERVKAGSFIRGKVMPPCLGLLSLLLFSTVSEAISTAPRQFWFGEEHGSWTFSDVFHDSGQARTKPPSYSSSTGQDLAGFIIEIETPGAREGALLRGTGTRADCPWSLSKRKSIASACEGI